MGAALGDLALVKYEHLVVSLESRQRMRDDHHSPREVALGAQPAVERLGTSRIEMCRRLVEDR